MDNNLIMALIGPKISLRDRRRQPLTHLQITSFSSNACKAVLNAQTLLLHLHPTLVSEISPLADLVVLVCPPTPAMPPCPYIQKPPPPPPLSTTSTSDMLLPPLCSIGPSMPLAAFCLEYNVTEVVQKKLDDEGYTDAHLLQYVSIAELKEASFKNGEIASLRYAVSKWSVLTVPV
jgi:hypothetical protein